MSGINANVNFGAFPVAFQSAERVPQAQHANANAAPSLLDKAGASIKNAFGKLFGSETPSTQNQFSLPAWMSTSSIPGDRETPCGLQTINPQARR